MGRPTLGDVARAAGVHKATASRALNEATVSRVQPETARRVREAANALGYQPNIYARGLRTRSTQTIGVVLPDIVNPLYPPVMRGIEDALASHGYTALLANTDIDPQREQSACQALLSRQVDGFVVEVTEQSVATYAEAARRGTPVVVLGDPQGEQGVSSVGLDELAGLSELIGLLTELGHRRIAHLSAPEYDSERTPRLAAFTSGLRAHGLNSGDAPVVSARALSVAAGQEAMQTILERYPDVTAVAAHNDTVAVGAMRAVRHAGLRCPEDISVVGFNDIPMVAELSPALTTVRLPKQEQGYAAAQALLSHLGASSPPTHTTLQVVLVPRSSAGPARLAERVS